MNLFSLFIIIWCVLIVVFTFVFNYIYQFKTAIHITIATGIYVISMLGLTVLFYCLGAF
jgi:hypothetical protein